MKDFATKYIAWYDSIPMWAKVLLCFLWAIPAGLYRFSKSALADNNLGMVLAIILTLIGGEIVFIIDIVCLVIKNKILWFDNIDEILSTVRDGANSEESPAEENKAEDAPLEADSIDDAK